MRKLQWGLPALVFATFGCGNGDDLDETAGGEQDQEVVMVQPRASALDTLVAALGGDERLGSLSGLRITGSGVRFIPNEGVRPDDAPIQANSFERAVALDFAADSLRVDTSRDIEFLFPGSQMYSDIVRGNLGASTQLFFGTPLGALGSDKVASIRRQELLLTPALMVRGLAAGDVRAEADVEMDGVTYQRVVASGGPAPVTFFINADSGELAKLETLELDFYRRDVSLEVFFDNWSTTDDLPFPRSLRVARAGQTLFTEEVSAVEVNPTFEATAFDFPADVSPSFDAELYERGELSHQWYYLLDSIGLPFNGIDRSIAPTEIGPGVLQLVGASHHSFVVEQETGLVLVDAPLHDDRGGALVDFLAERYPDNEIKDVIVSHFHEDHVSGIREVLGRTQARLVVQASSEAFWREILAAPSTLKPDALAQNPREVTIVTVPDGGELEIPDSINPVTLYHLATDHAADMLLTYQPTSNSVFVVDIYSPGNATQLGAGDLDAAIIEHAIPTENLTIVGGHGATSDYAALQAQLP
ncbi:MAG TPA: MBL fold metallo-hydrolase [Polyangiaceae bacterium]|nr:MBL fold metallo-hydrolase [Polyangiaceae bacterium]